MTKVTLIAIAVLSAMPNGYRRAGFALNKGENSPLEVNQEQYDLLSADKNLTVSIVDGELVQADIGTHVKSERILQANLEQMRNENALLQSQVDTLTKLCEGQEQSITQLEEALDAAQSNIHEDTLADLAGVGERTFGFDCCTAPEELHCWITVIDDLNKEAPLTKKPNCDQLTITADDKELTPSAAERDAAWAWYQDNILVTSADADKAETEA